MSVEIVTLQNLQKIWKKHSWKKNASLVVEKDISKLININEH